MLASARHFFLCRVDVHDPAGHMRLTPLVGRKMFLTEKYQRVTSCKLCILEHSNEIGLVAVTCGYFGIGQLGFERWRDAYRGNGVEGPASARPVPSDVRVG